jgi:hypothetical protein
MRAVVLLVLYDGCLRTPFDFEERPMQKDTNDVVLQTEKNEISKWLRKPKA